MNAITAKSTKAEILQAYEEAVNRPPATWSDVTTLILQSVSTVRREIPLLVTDCYKLGQWLRAQATFVVEELSRPVIKA